MTKWTGQLTLADFLPIQKPTNTIKCKVYIPSYELQGQDEEISPADVKDWERVKQSMTDQFLRDFRQLGTYADNKLNRRLNRVGKSFSHTKMIALMDVTNDDQLSKVQTELTRVKEERRDFVLSKGFLLSANVDELERNVSIESELEVQEIPVFSRLPISTDVRDLPVEAAQEAIRTPKEAVLKEWKLTMFRAPPGVVTSLTGLKESLAKDNIKERPQFAIYKGEKLNVRSDFRVEIPKRLREKYDLKPGDTVDITFKRVN